MGSNRIEERKKWAGVSLSRKGLAEKGMATLTRKGTDTDHAMTVEEDRVTATMVGEGTVIATQRQEMAWAQPYSDRRGDGHSHSVACCCGHADSDRLLSGTEGTGEQRWCHC